MTKRRPLQLALLSTLLIFHVSSALAQDSTFTYQGRLTDGGTAANGIYDIQFKLYDSLSDGNLVGSPNTVMLNNPGVMVTNGIFSVQLDFGASGFTGAGRYLEIAVRPHSSDSNTPAYTTLSPRQQLTSSPYAIRSSSAASADDALKLNGLAANQYVLTTDSRLSDARAASSVNFNTATLTGALPINNGGTGSATKNFVDLTTNQTVGGNKTFTGKLSGDGSGLTNLNAASVVGSTAINPQRLAILRWYDVNAATATRPIAVGHSPLDLVFDGTFMWVSNRGDNTLTRIRAATGVVEGSPIAVSPQPGALAYDGTFIYVANTGDNTVTRVRASNGIIEGSAISLSSHIPAAMAFDGTFIDVTTNGGLIRIRAATGVVEGTPIAVGANPNGLAFDGTYIYVANSGSNNVTRIRAATGLVEGSIPVGINPQELAFDGTFIWVANLGSTNISRIRAATGVVEGNPIPSPGSPFGIAFDGTFLYVANINGNNVTRIRAATGTVEGSAISVGQLPLALAFDGTYVYVANFNSNTVTRF